MILGASPDAIRAIRHADWRAILYKILLIPVVLRVDLASLARFGLREIINLIRIYANKHF